MLSMVGEPKYIKAVFIEQDASVAHALDSASAHVKWIKRQIADYQGAALYTLAKRYNRVGAHILEIGTAWGYSAALLSLAAPSASIITLNPRTDEADVARGNLRAFANVRIVTECSWDYLNRYTGPELDFIFVDGDHKRIRMDLPWWNMVAAGGMMLFHDYSPDGSRRPCPPVYEALNEYKLIMGRDFDVQIIDDTGVGLVGWYKE